MKTVMRTCARATASLFGAAFLLQAPAAASTLYEDMGGADGMEAVASGMLTYALADERIAETFGNSNLERLEGLLIEHFCDIADGPCTYTGQDMDRVHTGLGINNMKFNALVENLQKAMDDADIPYRTQNRFLARLAPIQRDIVK